VLGVVIKIGPIEKKSIVLTDISRLRRAALLGLSGGAIFGLMVVLIKDGRIAGVIEGLIAGFLIGMAGLLSPQQPLETRRVPNQGTKRSAMVALATVLIIVIILGPVVGLVTGVGPVNGMWAGLILGLMGGLGLGGLFCLTGSSQWLTVDSGARMTAP